jgi:PKD repeat protein
MALTKLFDSVLYPPGDIVVDNSGYVIIDDPSTGMYAYQWTGSTLSLITSYLVPSVSIYGNRSIYYNGTYLFRIVGSNLKAYTFNGSVFAEVGSIALTYSSSISTWAVEWGGTQIVINSNSPFPFGHMMLFTFSGSFTYYGTFTPSPYGLFNPYTPHQMMYGSFTGGTYQVSDAGYLGAATVNPGPTPGSINMYGGGGGTKLFSKRNVKFYTLGGFLYANGNVTNRYMDYGGVNLDYDGTYLYLVSNVSGTPKVEKIDITTNPCTVIDSVTYTGTYYDARVAGRNDLIFVNESSGPYLSVWSAPTVVADFSATPLSGNASLTVNFTDLSTGATSWDWDFGDGGTSTLQNPTHIYTVAGTYTVTLSVNSGAATITKTNYITVNMVADFTATPVVGMDSLTVSFTDISLGTPTSWAWDFGDSYTSTEQNPVHTYDSAGVYTVTLRAIRGSFEDTETKDELIKIGFIDSIQKLSYIRILPRLSTEDIAPPVSRPDLRIMYVNGVGNYSYPKKGIRAFISSNTSVVSGSGFKRPQGPTLIFD